MIAAAIARVRPRIDDCAVNFTSVGRVNVSVTVAPDGTIKTVTVGETSDRWLAGCVATQLRKARLPATTRGGAFSYAFAF